MRRLRLCILLGGLLVAPCGAAAAAPRLKVGPEVIVGLVAKGFFHAVLEARLNDALAVCAPRVAFEGKWVSGETELQQELSRLIDRASSQTLQLRRVDVLSYREMVRRFGPPPNRLRQIVRPDDMLALARFDRRGAIAVLRQEGSFWRIAALTD